MKTLIQTLALGVVLVSLLNMGPSSANAEGKRDRTSAPGINNRIERQKKRISHKLEKGKITQDQANKLNQNVDAVQAKEAELAKDGKLTREERKGLRQDLNKSSQEIKGTGTKGSENSAEKPAE